MKWAVLFGAIVCSLFTTGTATAQLFFHTTFDQYEHPKSHWERWAQTKPGDFVEYSDGERVFARFEALEVGDHTMKIRTTTWNPLLPRPEVREIRHLFQQDEPKFGMPTSTTDDKLKLEDREFEARKQEFLAFDKQLVKEVWYSDAVPFDGTLKYQQYTLGKPSGERFVARFRKGESTFGKVDEPAAVVTKEPTKEEPPKPDAPLVPKPDTDPAPMDDGKFRTWTSADGKQTIEAEIVRTTPTGVVLKLKADGKVLNLALKQLSQADRDYLKELRKTPKK